MTSKMAEAPYFVDGVMRKSIAWTEQACLGEDIPNRQVRADFDRFVCRVCGRYQRSKSVFGPARDNSDRDSQPHVDSNPSTIREQAYTVCVWIFKVGIGYSCKRIRRRVGA